MGTEAEVAAARKRLETEGRAENLKTYIELHKEVIVPADELKKSRFKWDSGRTSGTVYAEELRGCCYINREDSTLIFIDSKGNIAQVKMNLELIGDQELSGRSLTPRKINDNLQEKLKGLGFKVGNFEDSYFDKRLQDFIREYKKREKKEKEETFDL